MTDTMAKAKAKTVPVPDDARVLIDALEDDAKRADSLVLLEMMERVTGETPVVWRGGIIGFGQYHYVYDSGHEGTFFLTGFAPRKREFSVYIMPGFSNEQAALDKLGKARTGRSCLYIKRLSDIDMNALEGMIERAVTYMRKHYPTGSAG